MRPSIISWTHRWEEPQALAPLVVPTVFGGYGLIPENRLALSADPVARGEELYRRLRALGIHYDTAPWTEKRDVQAVRRPTEIVGDRRATCLDIALFFAGMCVAAHLRPLVALLEPLRGPRHALVLLPPFGDEAHENDVWGRLPTSRGLLTPDAAQIGEVVEDSKWAAVDVVGALIPSSGEGGPLGFAEARSRAAAMLERYRSLRLLDIVHLHNRMGRTPDPDARPLLDVVRRATVLGDGVVEAFRPHVARAAEAAGRIPPVVWDAASLRALYGAYLALRHHDATTPRQQAWSGLCARP